MAPERLSRLQRRILAWLAQDEQRTRGTMAASHQDLVHALGADKGNLSHSLVNLEAKGLVQITRTPGGKAEAVDVTPTGRREVVNKERIPMTINQLPLTRTRWRRLAPELRAELRQVLGSKQAIVNRPVVDVARALCARDAALLAWHLYQGLDGQPFTPYQGCGLGLTMDLRTFMGEDGEPWMYGSEDAPLLLPK